MPLSIFAGRNYARFRKLWIEQAKKLVENLSLSGGMRAFLNKHPVESVYGKLERGEFSCALVDLIAGTYENTSKIDLKVDDLMSVPSIEKEQHGTVYMIITQNRNGDFVYIGSISCWKEKKFCWNCQSSHGIMAKEMAVEGAINSFKFSMSLYLPPSSKNLEERKIRKASLLVCESVLIGLFGTRLGGAYNNCPFVTHYKGGNQAWPLHDGGWVKETNWLKRREEIEQLQEPTFAYKRRATAGTEGERRALGFPIPTEDQFEARRAKDRQYQASWTPEYKVILQERKRKKKASLTEEQRQAINKQEAEAARKKRAKMTEEQKAEFNRRMRNAYYRKKAKKANVDDIQRERNRVKFSHGRMTKT